MTDDVPVLTPTDDLIDVLTDSVIADIDETPSEVGIVVNEPVAKRKDVHLFMRAPRRRGVSR